MTVMLNTIMKPQTSLTRIKIIGTKISMGEIEKVESMLVLVARIDKMGLHPVLK